MNNAKRCIKTAIGNYSIKLSVFLFSLQDRGGLWKGLFSCYKSLLHKLNLSIFPVVDANAYKEKTGNVQITVLERDRAGRTGRIQMARMAPENEGSEVPLSDLTLQEYHNVCIRGNSDIIVDADNGYVISEVSYNLASNEEVVDGLLYRTRKRVCLLRDNLSHQKEKITSGIMISGKFCKNYYHLIYENLIRLLYVDQAGIPEDVSILIDKGTLEIPSCKRIFEILTEDSGREIRVIDETHMYLIETLYCFSRVNKLPAHSINPHISVPVVYYPKSIKLLKEKLIEKRSHNVFPERFFISRKSLRGRQFNEDDVFEKLEKFGFARVSPEQYSIEDQMSLFNGAEFIVSGSGAALTNLLFVNSNCTVICFGRGNYDQPHNVPVFSTIAEINGANFYFFPRKTSVKNNIHINYEIDCEDFEKWFQSIIK